MIEQTWQELFEVLDGLTTEHDWKLLLSNVESPVEPFDQPRLCARLPQVEDLFDDFSGECEWNLDDEMSARTVSVYEDRVAIERP